jgi:hypothetical protein
VEAYAAAHPALAAALEDGALRQRAKQVTMLWKRANEQRVAELRRADGIRAQMSHSHVHRTLTGVARAFTTKHETVCACSARCNVLHCAAGCLLVMHWLALPQMRHIAPALRSRRTATRPPVRDVPLGTAIWSTALADVHGAKLRCAQAVPAAYLTRLHLPDHRHAHCVAAAR